MSPPISRRAFLTRTTLLVAAMPGIARSSRERLASFSLRLGVVNMPQAADDPRGMGLLLGVEEARRAASMFGGALELVSIPPGEFNPRGFSAVIGNADTARCIALSTQANHAGVPFLNVACSADALRGPSCRPTLFHVAPSDAMSRGALSAASTGGAVTAWHSSLERFGADTLNRRFQARFKREMASDAWTAWMGVKILWESSLRVRSGDPTKLLDYLARDTTQFDGHKGTPLSFRSWDRQLRQPLYVVSDSRVIEVPIAGSPGESVRDFLDRLGTRAADSLCRIGS
jgi:hypothetical protein